MWKLIKNNPVILIVFIIGITFMALGLTWWINQYALIVQSQGINDFFARSYNPIGFFILGLVLVLLSWSEIRLDILNPLRKEKLEKTGEKIEATIKTIKVTGESRKKPGIGVIRHHSHWRIKLEFTENDRTFSFWSQSLNFHPKDLLKKFNITSLPVWVDQNNMKKYYVDIEKLLELKNK